MWAGNVELSIQMCYVLSSQANNELVPYAVLTMMFINKMPGSVNSKLRLVQYAVNCFIELNTGILVNFPCWFHSLIWGSLQVMEIQGFISHNLHTKTDYFWIPRKVFDNSNWTRHPDQYATLWGNSEFSLRATIRRAHLQKIIWSETIEQQKNRCFKVFDFSHCTYENATNNKLSAVSDLVKIDS